MEKEDKLKFFRNELNLIHDNDLQKFAIEILSNADEYFFHVPASSSGKYHPKFALGEGGLVRHTKAVMQFSRYLAESREFNSYATDIVIVAALAHDIKKQGDGKDGHTVKDHADCAAAYLEELYNNGCSKYIRKDIFETIQHAVLTHMGQWGNVKPSNEYDNVVHEADYIASRKDLNLIFD